MTSEVLIFLALLAGLVGATAVSCCDAASVLDPVSAKRWPIITSLISVSAFRFVRLAIEPFGAFTLGSEDLSSEASGIISSSANCAASVGVTLPSRRIPDVFTAIRELGFAG